jgi:hypothetical protein
MSTWPGEGKLYLLFLPQEGKRKTLHKEEINPLHAQLNPIYHLLALLGAHHIFHVSGLRFN